MGGKVWMLSECESALAQQKVDTMPTDSRVGPKSVYWEFEGSPHRLVVGGAHPTGLGAEVAGELLAGGAQPTGHDAKDRRTSFPIPPLGQGEVRRGGLVSSGAAGLDEVLPEGGYRRGTLVDFLSVAEGCGAELLALLAAREACRQGGALVVLDTRGEFYPPAAFDLGIDPRRLLVVSARRADEALWAWDQALRCRGVGAVVGWLERLGDRLFRRLRLAAEAGGALGLFLRPASFQSTPSWSQVRWLVGAPALGSARRPLESASGSVGRALEPAAGRPGILSHATPAPRGMKGGLCFPIPAREWGRGLSVELLRCPGGKAGARVELTIDETTGAVHLVPQLVGATVPARAPGRPAGAG